MTKMSLKGFKMFLPFIIFGIVSNFAVGQDIGNLYPFGSSASDTALPDGNDLSTLLQTSTPFIYYEEMFDTLYINTNGIISFNNSFTKPQTDGFENDFPLHPDWDRDGTEETLVLIGPFWADVDTSGGRGDIFFRQSTDTQLLNRVSSDVRDLFMLYSDYSAIWAFIATWDGVSFFEHNTAASTDPRNTFQLVLTTDGIRSFAFFRYETVEWVAGTTLSANPDTGTADEQFHAVVGFNKGDGYTGSENGFPQDVLNLPTDSNVDVDGLYAFQIDTAEIIQAGCDSDAEFVYTYPVYGNMFGGEKVYLNGPCWGISEDLKCKFSYGDTDLQICNGTQVDRQTAYCVPEPFFMVGELMIEVSLDGGNTWQYSGVYRLVLPSRVPDLTRVTRNSPDSDGWDTAGNSLTITWPSSEYDENDLIDAHVLAYREDGNQGPRWEEVYTIATGEANDGSISFTPNAFSEVTEDNAFGLIRIQPSNGGVGRKLYTTEHALGYILEEEYQEDTLTWSNNKCLEWASADDAMGTYTSSLISCPCTLDQALADSGRFQPDTGCSMFAGSVCTYHVGAKHCVRSVFASESNAGTQCCYNEDGYLMYAGDSDQGSTNDRSHVWGSVPYLEADMVPSLSHWKHDVITFYYCCLWGTDCKTYMERRITMDCFNYEPGTNAAMFGDPHIISLDNANNTFNGKGEYTLLDINDGSFRLDGRFEVVPTLVVPGQQDGATVITAVVMADDFSDVIYVEKDQASGLAIYRGQYDNLVIDNWERIVFRDQTWLDLQGVSININDVIVDRIITSVTFMFSDRNIGVNITSEEDQSHLAVSVILPPDFKDSGNVRGMLGNFNGDPYDDLQTRSGSVLDPDTATEEEIYQAYLTWETTEAKLFRYTIGKDHAYYQNANGYNPVLVAPDESSLSSSEQTIMDNTCGDIEQCRFDYLVTRDEDMASATATAVEDYQWVDDVMMKIQTCPFFNTPRNGSKTYSQMEDGEVISYDNNNFVGTTLRVECEEGSVLVGSPERICQENGEYSGSENINDCIVTPCGSLPVVENGYMSYSNFEGTHIIIVTCDSGYKLEGASRHECTGDSWSGSTSSCVDDKNGGKIAGIVIGSIFGAALLIGLIILAILFLPKYMKQPKNKPKTARPVYYDAENPNSPHSISQISVHTAGKYDYQDPVVNGSTGAPSVKSTTAPSIKSTGARSNKSNNHHYQTPHKDDDMSSYPSSIRGNDEPDDNVL